MGLQVRVFAKSVEPSIKRSRSFDENENESDDEEISYLHPPTSTQGSSSRRQYEESHYIEVPKFRDEKPYFGPVREDGNISVKYPSMIDGYGNDDNTLAQIESLGLPTGFSL